MLSFTSGVITLNWLKILSISFYIAFLILFILGGLNISEISFHLTPTLWCLLYSNLLLYLQFYVINSLSFMERKKMKYEEKKEGEKYIKTD